MNIPKQTERELLAGLPPSALFDLARNGSARWSARKTAVSILIEQSDPRAKHPELAELVYAVAAETLGGEEGFPIAKPAPEESFPAAGPFRASVTTETMFRDEAEHKEELKKTANQGFFGPHDPSVPPPQERLDVYDSDGFPGQGSFPLSLPSETCCIAEPVYSKPQLPRQPIVSIDVPALEPFDPEK